MAPIIQLPKLGPFIHQNQDWILFTLLLFLFWALVGLALRKHFENNRMFRVLVTTLALTMAVGVYYSIYQGWLHLSLQGFGMFGAVILFLAIFFIIFGMIKGFGVSKGKALPLGFIFFYFSMHAVSPNISDNIAEIFPLGNGILGIMFLGSLLMMFMSFFHHAEMPAINFKGTLKKIKPQPVEPEEIGKEQETDKAERKDIKKQAVKITKSEIQTVDDLEKDIVSLIETLETSELNQEGVNQISHTIMYLGPKLQKLMKGLSLLNRHVQAYKNHHNKDIYELGKRLNEARSNKNEKQAKLIADELTYQKRMLQSIAFLESSEIQIKNFYTQFVECSKAALRMLTANPPIVERSIKYIKVAMHDLKKMKNLFKTLNQIEAYLLKMDKKLLKNLKHEKAQ